MDFSSVYMTGSLGGDICAAIMFFGIVLVFVHHMCN